MLRKFNFRKWKGEEMKRKNQDDDKVRELLRGRDLIRNINQLFEVLREVDVQRVGY